MEVSKSCQSTQLWCKCNIQRHAECLSICLYGGQRLAEEQQDRDPLRSNFSSELATWNPQEKMQISSRSSEKDCMCGHLDRGLGYSESFLPQLWAPLSGLFFSWEYLVFKAILSFQSPKGTSSSVLVKEASLNRERLAEREVLGPTDKVQHMNQSNYTAKVFLLLVSGCSNKPLTSPAPAWDFF